MPSTKGRLLSLVRQKSEYGRLWSTSYEEGAFSAATVLLETPGEAEQIPEFHFLEGYRVPVRLPRNKDPERGELLS